MRLYRRAWGLIHLNPAPSARRASVPAPVPETAEHTLNQRIQEASPEDAKMTGLLLIKEAGFPAGEACQLRWEDEKFNQMGRPETAIQFEIKKDFSAGPTHDYQRPGSPRYVGELYSRKYLAQHEAELADYRAAKTAIVTWNCRSIT